jgi:hypothetical protein
MFIIRGKYFEKARMLFVNGPTFTLTIKRVYNLGCLNGVLRHHGLKLRNHKKRWVKNGNIYYAELTRITK